MTDAPRYQICRNGGRYFVEVLHEGCWRAVHPSTYLDNTTAEWFTDLDDAKCFVQKIINEELKPLPYIAWKNYE